MQVLWVIASVTTAAIAWFVSYNIRKASQKSLSLENKEAVAYAIYVIGDLHGDAECARQWVDRTGLIDASSNTWIGDSTAESSYLIFMGDYVDKGITSRQTVEYVKSLTDAFPTHVTAILGNHELELLRDRTHKIWGDNKAGYFQLPYSSVHPGEYLNYIEEDDSDSAVDDPELDRIVVEALYNVSLEIYARGLYRSTFFTTDLEHKGSFLHLMDSDSDDAINLRDVVQRRLAHYQEAYLNTYRTGTTLGTWLEERPVVAMLHDNVFVHGGVSPPVAKALQTLESVQKLNNVFAEHAVEQSLHPFLQQHLYGRTVYELVTFRGNHKPNACDWLFQVLPIGVTRLVVGHTPDDRVRIRNCGVDPRAAAAAAAVDDDSIKSTRHSQKLQILAVDSALSRWFRNSGNDYCYGEHANVSTNGRYTCERKSDQCEGQIVRLTPDKVDILEL